MTTVAIVQARMSSSRLPGKVLAPIDGTPMIVQQLRRLERSRHIDRIVVATSTDATDDPLIEVLEVSDYSVVRGPSNNVLERFRLVVETEQPDVVVRITADCPLISPTVVDDVVEAFLAARVDYASNTLDPTFPDGLDVEVVTPGAVIDIAGMQLDADEREHVTLGIYRRPGRFRLHSVQDTTKDNSGLRWTVDTQEDLDFVRWVFSEMKGVKDFDYHDVLDLVSRFPERSRTREDGARNAALQGKDTGRMRGVAP